jgi:hypothetical protein
LHGDWSYEGHKKNNEKYGQISMPRVGFELIISVFALGYAANAMCARKVNRKEYTRLEVFMCRSISDYQNYEMAIGLYF